jgi:hypothetical protein
MGIYGLKWKIYKSSNGSKTEGNSTDWVITVDVLITIFSDRLDEMANSKRPHPHQDGVKS